MSDQRIGTATVCLTSATLHYAVFAGCTRPYPGRHERGLGPGRARRAEPAVGTAGAWPRAGRSAAAGATARVRCVPLGPAPGAGAVGRALGALAGLPHTCRPGRPARSPAAGVGAGRG